jgi:hypothetical protein
MGRQGVVMVLSLLVLTVLFILVAAFFTISMNENNLSRRYVNSIRAFWAAEAGIAEAASRLPHAVSGCLAGASSRCCYSTTVTPVASRFYRIDATGTASLSRGGSTEVVNRLVSAVVMAKNITNNFHYGIETTVDLVIRGSVDINPGDSKREFSAINFPDLFGSSKPDVESYATYTYTNPGNDVTPVEGITWVNMTPGSELRINSRTWHGSGILIVAGDAQITGGTFDGIIYVIGKLRMSGNPVINGTILAESNTELVEDTTLTGNVTINYDPEKIDTALNALRYIAPEPVSWREM